MLDVTSCRYPEVTLVVIATASKQGAPSMDESILSFFSTTLYHPTKPTLFTCCRDYNPYQSLVLGDGRLFLQGVHISLSIIHRLNFEILVINLNLKGFIYLK